MPEHKDLTGADLHEAKGADTALAGQLLVADGAGGAQWKHTGESVHGEMTIISNATPEVVPTAVDPTLNTDADYTKVITGWTAGHLDGGITFNTDELVVPYSGEYEVAAWANILCPSNNQKVALKYGVNDITPYSSRKLIGTAASAGDYVNVAGHGVVTLNATDQLGLWIATTLAGDPTVVEAGLFIKLLETA